ncbi:MAG: polyamine aminopropyltransferase [Spirochaetes bacterium]|nr:polyamine aminopropyltransferase [Spirochaetota bacterium]
MASVIRISPAEKGARLKSSLLLFSAFIIAACGLVYELIAGTVSSYLLGDSVTQFSRTIGVYLFAMGIGSYLSKFIVADAPTGKARMLDAAATGGTHSKLIEKFIELEVALAFFGGMSAPLLFFLFTFTEHYEYLLYTLLIAIGTLVGLEIPLLLRILKDRMHFRDLVARVLSLDYIGGLVAAVSFPILLLRPEVGLVRASLIAGFFNVVVAFVAIYIFQKQIRVRASLLKACAVLCALTLALVYSKPLQSYLDHELHTDPVVYSEQSHYQKIVITSWHEYFSLFLNNNLQFNSFDEYRYHEALVHVPTQLHFDKNHTAEHALKILIMGGGDGLAVREFLRYENIERIDLVDIDPAVTALAKNHVWLRTLNANALHDPRVYVYHEDAFLYIQKPKLQYDVVVLDFPDPGNFAIGKLYSDIFFSRLRRAMAPGAVAVTQSTSPFVARSAFWCIHNTIAAQGFKTLPYHTYVPSFGEWGFVAFADYPLSMPSQLRIGNRLRFLNRDILQSMAYFPSDMAPIKTEIQTLMTQNLVHYYEKEWHRATR